MKSLDVSCLLLVKWHHWSLLRSWLGAAPASGCAALCLWRAGAALLWRPVGTGVTAVAVWWRQGRATKTAGDDQGGAVQGRGELGTYRGLDDAGWSSLHWGGPEGRGMAGGQHCRMDGGESGLTASPRMDRRQWRMGRRMIPFFFRLHPVTLTLTFKTKLLEFCQNSRILILVSFLFLIIHPVTHAVMVRFHLLRINQTAMNFWLYVRSFKSPKGRNKNFKIVKYPPVCIKLLQRYCLKVMYCNAQHVPLEVNHFSLGWKKMATVNV